MTTQAIPQDILPPSDARADRWDPLLVWARAGWWLMASFVVACFALGAPILSARLQQPCRGTSCPSPQITVAQAAALHRLGFTPHAYALYVVTLEAFFVLGFIAVGAVLAAHQGTGWLALLGAWMLVLMGGTAFPDTISALRDSDTAWWWIITCLQFLGSASIVPFFYLFPDGRFVRRWTAAAAVGWVVLCALGFFTPLDFPLNQDPNNPRHLFPVLAGGFVISALAAQVIRYRHISTRAQQQQVKWVAFGLLVAFAGLFAGVFLVAPNANDAHPSAIALRLLGLTDGYVVLLLIPLSIGIAIWRFQLWDIDLLLHRTLVYGALTGAVVAIYVAVVTAMSQLFRIEKGSLLPSLLATALVAVLFQPLRTRVQHAASHLLYGQRDDPYAVLSRLGERLSATLAPDAVLPAVTQTICEMLKLPYATIDLRNGQGFSTAASNGTPEPVSLCLPLVYQHETVGRLCLAPRARGEPFDAVDRRLLQDLARQAGVAAHAVGLASELQHARERLVTGREEERRRLRRDLHDGLGPLLGGFLLKIGVAEDLVGQDPAAARALLSDLKTQTRSAIDDIRRLVYALRPAALDELGLIGALREGAAACERSDLRLRVTIDTPEPLPPLPAAVEVAAFRIAQEALTNVVRHADARCCTVSFSFDVPDMLCLDIVDDGRGLAVGQPRGLGLANMRERAEELGGTFGVDRREDGGTRVHACLPL